MKLQNELNKHPYLKQALISYLLLGMTDTVHHLHAATALGHSAAFYAVALGVVLIPLAIAAAWLFLLRKTAIAKWCFLSIALLAVVVPGFYHGGWDHLMKVLAHLRLEGDANDIALLFPSGSLDHWFYEISGMLELVLAAICAYFVYKFINAYSKTPNA